MNRLLIAFLLTPLSLATAGLPRELQPGSRRDCQGSGQGDKALLWATERTA